MYLFQSLISINDFFLHICKKNNLGISENIPVSVKKGKYLKYGEYLNCFI